MGKKPGTIHGNRLAGFRRRILEWHAANGRRFPWRESTDRYEVLIGEVLLQRTRGEHVVEVYREFLQRWPTPEKLSRAQVATIARVIRPLGLPKRAPILKGLGKALVELGEVPSEPAELAQLPGIGPYGAHAVPIFADGLDLPLVDWVIARVLRRYFGLPAGARPNADEELWALSGRLADLGQSRELWLGVLDISATVCVRIPRCHDCPLARSCLYRQELAGPGPKE